MTPAGMQGQDAYRISRVIDNNFVCITDADGHEVILRGLGIGFKKQPGDLVPAQKIEKIYDLRDPEKSSRLMELLGSCSVVKLRYLARSYPEFEIAGRAISKANRSRLLKEFERWYDRQAAEQTAQ